MTQYSSEDLIGRFYLHCDQSEIVGVADLESGGVLALLKLTGFQHLHHDWPFDAYVVGAHTNSKIFSGEWLNCGVEWFGLDEFEAAQDSFNFRRANNPLRAHRGTIAHEIGRRSRMGAPTI